MHYKTKEELFKEIESAKKEMADYSVGRVVRSGFGVGLVKRHISENTRKSLRILDIAAASGGGGHQLQEAGFSNVIGVDIYDFRDPALKDIYQEFKVADLNYEKLPWSDNYFDAMIGWCILPHLENPHNLIREIHRTLKPNGLLFITMPNIFLLSARLEFLKKGDFKRYKAKNDHISLFPQSVFQKTILKYFDLVEEDYFIREDEAYPKKLTITERFILATKLYKRFKKLKKLVGYNIAYVLQKK